MKLDGQQITVGQTVYDVAFGAGVVTSMTLGLGIEVTFSQGGAQGYKEDGTGVFPNRTLYIAPPDVFPPLIDKQKRILFSQVARTLHTELGR